MAHFRGAIQGNRGEASRLGTKSSGICANIDGWTTGVTVNIWYDEEAGVDRVRVQRTGGSGYGEYESFEIEWSEEA